MKILRSEKDKSSPDLSPIRENSQKKEIEDMKLRNTSPLRHKKSSPSPHRHQSNKKMLEVDF